MTLEEFQKKLAQMSIDMQRAVNSTIPDKVGNKAVSLFKKNFRDEAFFGKAWIKTKKAQGKTLTDSGDLGRSVQYKKEPGQVTVYSDLPYSKVHNEGGIQDVRPHKATNATTGKRYNVKGYAYRAIKRQFIGDSPALQEEIKKVIEKEINKVMKQ
jgi:phage gpG-like protein